MATAAEHNAFHARKNDRGCNEVSHDGHISIENLIIDLQDENNTNQIRNDFRRLGITYKLKILDYLTRNIPNYPTPVEFHISEVSHVTHKEGLYGIWESEGFRSQADGDQEKLLWWSLKIDEDSKGAAEERYLETVFPNRSQEQKERQKSFLSKFTTSPAFHIDESRYGNFRFTLPLNELMETYKEQMCGGQDPVLREYKTIFYKQEIMYAVLIHSPEHNERFKNFPTIENSPFVSFVDHEKTVWKAQAIGNLIKFQLTLNEEDKTAMVEPESTSYYVWDHVCLAFHFDGVLKFPKETLKICTACELSEINFAKGTCCSYEEAQEILRNLQ